MSDQLTGVVFEKELSEIGILESEIEDIDKKLKKTCYLERKSLIDKRGKLENEI